MSDLNTIISQLRASNDPSVIFPLLSKAKIALLKANALTPTHTTPPAVLAAARTIFELGALASITNKDPDAFTRYYFQLLPFWDAESTSQSAGQSERAKITGLYLLLLLVKGDYAGFHTELEGLEMRGVSAVEDRFLGYPVKLERWLMEGSYDEVWKSMRGGSVPSREFEVFTEILIPRIRSEIASCSEVAYPSLPISSTKALLFLSDENAVVQFAASRGWEIRDGRIWFPKDRDSEGGEEKKDEEREAARDTVKNVVGYARELEMIV